MKISKTKRLQDKTKHLQEGQFYSAFINSFTSFGGFFSQRLFFSAIEFRQIKIKIWFYRCCPNYGDLSRWVSCPIYPVYTQLS